MGVVRGELKIPPDDFMESTLGFETEIEDKTKIRRSLAVHEQPYASIATSKQLFHLLHLFHLRSNVNHEHHGRAVKTD